MPITRRKPVKRAVDAFGSIGLGDHSDLLYSIPVKYNNAGVTIALNIDTGSADHWVITDQCNTSTCTNSDSARLPSSSVNSTGSEVSMFYGDSTTGTSAHGTVAMETISVAGLAMENQAFGAIDRTDNVAIRFGASGIFGLGFPSGSKIQQAVVTNEFGYIAGNTDSFISNIDTHGPLASRMSMSGGLERDVYAITLQRNQVDVGGEGTMHIGKLPDGVDESLMTWVPVRLYSVADGGMPPPSFARQEVYPFRWEVDIEGVFLNGVEVPQSTATGTSGGRVTALIDTGNSLIRGPRDVVNNILSTVSPSFSGNGQAPPLPCSTPHTLSYQIGGKRFPVDPRDFISPSSNGGAITCVADNLVPTDPPAFGAQFSWSLGDPFFKSNLVAFHFGNNTHPSVDPPMMGFMSLVPDNADDLLRQAVQGAVDNGGVFESRLDLAPTQAAQDLQDITLGAEPTGVQQPAQDAPAPAPTGTSNGSGSSDTPTSNDPPTSNDNPSSDEPNTDSAPSDEGNQDEGGRGEGGSGNAGEAPEGASLRGAVASMWGCLAVVGAVVALTGM